MYMYIYIYMYINIYIYIVFRQAFIFIDKYTKLSQKLLWCDLSCHLGSRLQRLWHEWMITYIVFYDVIIHPCSKFKGGLTKSWFTL